MRTDPTPQQETIPFVLMRGGTSKALFLAGSALPPAGPARDNVILALFGSPDPRQIDGLGGADLLTSKLAIIDPPSRPDADLDYTFAQVSVSEPVVDYDINCGNISAAVGAYAVDEGIVPAIEPVTTVRVHNTNTGRVLLARVPISDGHAAIEGDFAVDGVPGTGAAIALDYSQTAGGITGALLPTGSVIDVLDTPAGPIEVTIVDLANLCVFFAAESVGMVGTEGPGDITPSHLVAIAGIKTAASELLGMPDGGLTPIPALVSPPASYISFGTGEIVSVEACDLVARVVGGRPPVLHKAYPGTVAACTAVAACIPGTTVHDVVSRREEGGLVIGHTSGTMSIEVQVGPDGGGWRVEQASYGRTARRLAAGGAFVRQAAIQTAIIGG